MSSMPRPSPDGQPDPETEQIVLGVDTHKDIHVAAVVSFLGAHVADASFPTTAVGYRQLLAWARGFGVLHRAGVEGTGCYGAALTRYLRRQAITVIEVNRPDRAARRQSGKTDTVDALAAARTVLSARATITAKTADGPVEMLRMLRLARASAVKSRTQAVNQLKAVIVNTDPALRESLTGFTGAALIRHCANLPASAPTDAVTAARYTLRRLALRIQSLTAEERERQRHITAVLNTHAPQLLQRHGIGRDSTAALLVTAGDNPHPPMQRRLLRRPLRRQPDRGLLKQDPPAATEPRRRPPRQRGPLPHCPDPGARRPTHPRLPDPRTPQGRTRREAIRCVKRYIAREIYHLITKLNPQITPHESLDDT
jgi:transposase